MTALSLCYSPLLKASHRCQVYWIANEDTKSWIGGGERRLWVILKSLKNTYGPCLSVSILIFHSSSQLDLCSDIAQNIFWTCLPKEAISVIPSVLFYLSSEHAFFSDIKWFPSPLEWSLFTKHQDIDLFDSLCSEIVEWTRQKHSVCRSEY